MDEDGSTHKISAAVAYTPGKTKWNVYVGKGSIFAAKEEDVIFNSIPSVKYHLTIMADNVYADIGEGDSSNFLAGYKEIIVNKRAEDRAIMGLVLSDYGYEILTDQDAEIIDGQSGSMKPDSLTDTRSFESEEAREKKSYLALLNNVNKWISSVGVGPAKELVKSSSSVLSSLTEEHRNEILALVEDGASKSPIKYPDENKPEEVKEEEPTCPPMPQFILNEGNEGLLSFLNDVKQQILQDSKKYAMHVRYEDILNKQTDYSISDSVRSYIRDVVRFRIAQINKGKT